MSDKKDKEKTFNEAQFTASVEVAGPGQTHTGERFRWVYAIRTDNRQALETIIPAMEKRLLKFGYTPWNEQQVEQQTPRQAPQPQTNDNPPPASGQMTTQLTKVSAGPLSDKDTTPVFKGMTGKSKYLVNIYPDTGEAALQKLTTLGLDPNNPASLFAGGASEISTPGWTCLVGLDNDGKWANKILDIYPTEQSESRQIAQKEEIPF